MDHEPSLANYPETIRAAMFELRSPYLVVKGYTRMLQGERAGPLTDLQRQMLEQVGRACEVMQDAIFRVERMTDVEAPTSSRSRLGTASIALGPLLSEVLSALPSEWAGGVDVQTVTGQDDVSGDRDVLRQVLTGMVRFVFNRLGNGERRLHIHVFDPTDVAQRWIVIAATESTQESVHFPGPSLTPLRDRDNGYLVFDLAFAIRMIRAHGGDMLALPERLGVVVALPRPTAS